MSRDELKHLELELNRAIIEERRQCAELVRRMASAGDSTMYDVADMILARTDEYEFTWVK